MPEYSLMLQEDPEEEMSNEYYTILDREGKTVGRVLIRCEDKIGRLEYITTRVPFTLSLKRDILKSFREFHPEIESLQGFRVSGAKSPGTHTKVSIRSKKAEE